MRVVVQRVSEASVKVDGRTVGRIGNGLLLLAGIEKGDGEREIEFIAEKILNLRIFADGQDKMNLSVQQVAGEILSVSQFTLAARSQKGRRPDFGTA
ncbi:MAG TPA: D-aminoacyl-tRNA deacylase, partial [Acidobacteriota bacterium]